EGVFSIADRRDLTQILEEYGLSDDEDQIILSREINSESGRSVARINGRAVSSSVLREIGGRLIDIHGQHEGLAIFNTRTHLDMLDRYGGLIGLRDQVADQVGALRKVREELASLRQAAASRAERIEELRFLLEDVRLAKLRPGEEQDLLRERTLLQNGARITELIVGAYNLLYAGDENRRALRPVIETLGGVGAALDELARLDPAMQHLAAQAHELRYTAEDLAANVRIYRDGMEFDPARIEAIEDRLTLLRDLQRKYRADIDQILVRAQSAETEIERLTHSDEYLAELETQEQQLLDVIGTLAGDLSRRRRGIGEQLARAVEQSVRELSMPHVQFRVSMTRQADPAGVAAPASDTVEAQAPQRWAFDRNGIDRVEFLISPNPGEPLKPLARIASGGESARLLLALKSILSRVDEIPTLVFDEVDVGIGGRAGQVVGEKLWGISEQHQVICITHLPQVAAFGDSHYAISKQFNAGRTQTLVDLLRDDQRAEEIAAMLDGTPVSEHSRRSAREMLERALQAKGKSQEPQHALLTS
ncbi:MAG TPA: DNA repair protein RecN, partial [Roseiflexaceae bacterium]|nr:DNA repair protein RecN [Roseiflexaceae bacterium]